MAKTTARVPQANDKFDSFLNESTEYGLKARNGTTIFGDLGLSDAEKNKWVGYRDAWNPIYAVYKKNTERGIRDKSVTKQKNEARLAFTDWVTKPGENKLDRMNNSLNCTEDDRSVFHLKKRDETRTTRKSKIKEDIFISLKGLGGGDMRTTCRTIDDSSKPSIPDSAKAVEIRYKADTTPPTSVDECDKQKISTKAQFTFSAGAANAGKKIFAFARWVDTTDENRAGVWSEMVTVVIA